VADEHRKRFGVESSYRLLNKVQACTTSPDPGLRMLFVGIALLLVNMWVYLKWAVLGAPRRGGRYVDNELLLLARFKDFLLEAVKAIYGIVLVVQRPRLSPQSIKL
jgi:putative transposase